MVLYLVSAEGTFKRCGVRLWFEEACTELGLQFDDPAVGDEFICISTLRQIVFGVQGFLQDRVPTTWLDREEGLQPWQCFSLITSDPVQKVERSWHFEATEAHNARAAIIAIQAAKIGTGGNTWGSWLWQSARMRLRHRAATTGMALVSSLALVLKAKDSERRSVLEKLGIKTRSLSQKMLIMSRATKVAGGEKCKPTTVATSSTPNSSTFNREQTFNGADSSAGGVDHFPQGSDTEKPSKKTAEPELIHTKRPTRRRYDGHENTMPIDAVTEQSCSVNKAAGTTHDDRTTTVRLTPRKSCCLLFARATFHAVAPLYFSCGPCLMVWHFITNQSFAAAWQTSSPIMPTVETAQNRKKEGLPKTMKKIKSSEGKTASAPPASGATEAKVRMTKDAPISTATFDENVRSKPVRSN